MFEKEAEEYAKQNNPAEYGVRATHFTVLNSFKDGAEFGYNKANEWHYVKDGIFPTHSNRVLVFTDEGAGFGLYGLDDKKWHTYDTGFDVIAWKEIVLPELKESE
jgi:hypothetical protein